MRQTRGFTIIELMIVVAIIGILAAIAIPNFLKFQCKQHWISLGYHPDIGLDICDEDYTARPEYPYDAPKEEVLPAELPPEGLPRNGTSQSELVAQKLYDVCLVPSLSGAVSIGGLKERLAKMQPCVAAVIKAEHMCAAE